MSNFLYDLKCICGMYKIETRHITVIERFNEQTYAFVIEGLCGKSKIADRVSLAPCRRVHFEG